MRTPSPRHSNFSASGRVLLAAVITVLLSVHGAAVSPVAAVEPDRVASSFRSLTVPVAAGDDVLMVCEGGATPPGSSSALLAAFATSRSDGSTEGRRFSLHRNWDGAGVHVTYDGQHVDAELLPGSSTYPGTLGIPGRVLVSTAVTLRAIAAGWGAESACEVTINGVVVPGWVDQPTARAVYATTHDFQDGIAATTPICVAGMVCQGAAAGAGLSYVRASDGFVFSLFYPGYLGVWAGTVDPPGEPPIRVAPPDCWSGLPPSCRSFRAQPATGDWMYTLDVQATDRAAPLLFFVDLPL